MSRKAVLERTARNRELAKADAANRCSCCRKAIPKGAKRIVTVGSRESLVYCSDDCYEAKTQ